MSKRAIIGHVVGLPVMRLLAARISKTAIPRRTRGPDARRGQLRFVAGVWPAIVNAVRQRAALMVSWMHSVTVGMAAIVNAVGQRGALMVLWMHSVTVGMAAIVNAVRQRGALTVTVSWMHSVTVGMAGDSESNPAGMTGVVSTVGQTAARDSTTRSLYGSWGEARLVRFTSSHTRQAVNRPLPKACDDWLSARYRELSPSTPNCAPCVADVAEETGASGR
jgi:hypothetical protein